MTAAIIGLVQSMVIPSHLLSSLIPRAYSRLKVLAGPIAILSAVWLNNLLKTKIQVQLTSLLTLPNIVTLEGLYLCTAYIHRVKALGLYKKHTPPKRWRGYSRMYYYIKNSEFCQELRLFKLELVEVDLWEVGADVGGVAGIDIMPSGAHTLYLVGVGKIA